MNVETYIDLLLKKYEKINSFPFFDCDKNYVSFYAIMNFWDELFCTASGNYYKDYEASYEIKINFNDEYQPGRIYDIRSKKNPRRFSVRPTKSDTDFAILISYGFDDDFPDRTELGIGIDFDRNRLISAFQIIRSYTHYDTDDLDKMHELDVVLFKKYGHYFDFPQDYLEHITVVENGDHD